MARKQILVDKNYDVIVCGGGTSGVAAAIAAVRGGASTLLIERVGALGGQLSFSGPPGFAFAHLFNPRGEQDAAGIIAEIHARMLNEGHALPHLKPEHRLEAGYTFSYVDPDWFSMTIFEMIEEEGVELLLHSLVVDVVQDNDKVTGVVVENTNGTMIINSKIIIDCTGEGDIAVRAGAPYEYVDKQTVQPHTLSFSMDGVDWKELLAWIHKNPEQLVWFEHILPHWTDERKEAAHQKALEFYRTCEDPKLFGEIMGFTSLHKQGIETGEWHQFSGIGFFLIPREDGHVQAHMQHSSQAPEVLTDNAWDITRGEIECRRQNAMALKFFRKYIPGFRNAYLTRVCPELRLREGRRIMGDYKLTRDDVAAGQEFDDVIGKSHFKAGAHHTVDQNTIAQVAKVCPSDDGSYDIPYRCLVPLQVENMLIAGKHVSTDRDAYLRYLHQTMITGQAAGAAAALCVKQGVSPRALEKDVGELQRILKQQGAIIDGTH
jgi:ribulose 1,5-bisphosphate synthetase/thiazole synthase